MAKRKLKQNHRVSDDEVEFQRPLKQFKKQRNSTSKVSVKNTSIFSNEEHDISMDDGDLLETSDIAANDSYYENFSSFLKAFSFGDESDGEPKFSRMSQNASIDRENSRNNSVRRQSHNEVPQAELSFQESVMEEETEKNIVILPIPSKLTEAVLLQHPASLTLHGYVQVTVCMGSINIFGYKVRESEDIKVFSTEGTGLKTLSTLKSKHKSTVKDFKKKLCKLIRNQDIDPQDFIDDIGPTTTVLLIEKSLLPAPLQFLELYYPNALQTRWPRSENFEKDKMFSLCSNEQSFVIDIGDDFKMMSKEVNNAISQSVSDNADFGPRIMVMGDRNMGKSTLLRYLMNSALNKHPTVYFLDTDPGQTEYTPPGVVSLVRVTKPLLGPPFAHQKKPLRMVFIGSITPGTCPTFYDECVNRLLKYFNLKFPKETLFVNTMGWNKGMGALCIENLRKTLKPTMVIELVPPEPDLPLIKEIDEDGVTCLKAPSKVPSRESGAPSYNAKELRNFSIVAYLGQCQKSYLPVSQVNSFHPYCVSVDKIAVYVMGKKVPFGRLFDTMNCSIVALCCMDLSFILKSDCPPFPATLSDDAVGECLGFGLVRAIDETNRLLYIVTPLTLDQLKNVNAIIKGNIMVPDEIILKQTIENVPLPFTDHSHVAKTPGSKALCKRAFFRTVSK